MPLKKYYEKMSKGKEVAPLAVAVVLLFVFVQNLCFVLNLKRYLIKRITTNKY